jgi:FkbM family methyltransferase
MYKMKFRDVQVNFQAVCGNYTFEWLEQIAMHEWEPDTVSFVENNSNIDTFFVDIGASIGIFSLISASLGSSVCSYEPVDPEFETLIKNLAANPNFSNRVKAYKIALGNEAVALKSVDFKEFKYTDIISQINFAQGRQVQLIAINAFAEEAGTWGDLANGKSVVLKMDIEGAEYPILLENNNLLALKQIKAKCLIAFHPGAVRPHKIRIPVIARLAFELFKFRNRVDAKRIFSGITNHQGVIMRTNYDRVVNQKSFAKLIDLGILEFVIDFS